SVRVALIGITYPYATTAAAHQLLHDVAGWLVIPLAAAMMGVLIWYLGRLFVQVRPMTGRELLKA
ncbi:MAG: archaeosortase/exosortase family protein, partial [Planctomycetales bacterium]|nr:archaeosortase/exosortase family protein [Planctomycetales bacterium]